MILKMIAYSLYFLVLSNRFLFTIANNNTNYYHSNETIVEFNSTFISQTTIANISNEDIFSDDNQTISNIIENVSLSSIFMNSTFPSSSISLETTDTTSLLDLNTTFNQDNDSTTISPQMNETQVSTESTTEKNETQVYTEVTTEKNEEQITTVVSNTTTCELSEYGCCPNGFTERIGKI
jgi:hypothetical protein